MNERTFIQKYGPAALVTGASSGIGKVFAERLAQLGFDLVLVARRKELLETLQNDLQSRFGVNVLVIVQDLTEPDAAQIVYQKTQEAGLDVGLLINNAGYGSYGAFEEQDLQRELAMIDLACKTMVSFAHGFIPDMKKRGGGGILFLSSIVSQVPTPYMATYSAGKTFEFALSNALHGELKPYGIDVLAVLPGTTATEFFDVAKMTREMSFPKATPQHVVQSALNALGRKPYVIDGIPNKLLAFLTKFLPMRCLIPIAKFALRPGK